jgi:hypothetical protein
VTDVIVVVVIVAFFTATGLLVPALSRLTADSAAGEIDDADVGADSRSDVEVRS